MGVSTWPLFRGLQINHRWKPMSDGVPEFGMRESERTRSGPSDESLAIQVRNSGDKTAFGIIVGRYRARIIGLARKMMGTGHSDEADDVAQEVFVAAFMHRAAFRPGSPYRPWLYRIAVNRCLDRLKARSRQPQFTDWDSAPEPSVRDDREPLGNFLAAELDSVLQKAVDALPVNHRTVFVLRHIDELSYEEIAEATNQPIGTVKTNLFRARAALRVELSPYLASGEGNAKEQGGTAQ
jgi:RNA polymerase sigma-70 factor (ECF subfamily)